MARTRGVLSRPVLLLVESESESGLMIVLPYNHPRALLARRVHHRETEVGRMPLLTRREVGYLTELKASRRGRTICRSLPGLRRVQFLTLVFRLVVSRPLARSLLMFHTQSPNLDGVSNSLDDSLNRSQYPSRDRRTWRVWDVLGVSQGMPSYIVRPTRTRLWPMTLTIVGQRVRP